MCFEGRAGTSTGDQVKCTFIDLESGSGSVENAFQGYCDSGWRELDFRVHISIFWWEVCVVYLPWDDLPVSSTRARAIECAERRGIKKNRIEEGKGHE